MLSGLLSWTIQSILWAGVLGSWAREHQGTPEGTAPLSQDWKRWQGHFQVLFVFLRHLSFVSKDPMELCAQVRYKVPLEKVETAINF